VENFETATQSDTLPEVLRCAQDDRICEIMTESKRSLRRTSLQSSLLEFPLDIPLIPFWDSFRSQCVLKISPMRPVGNGNPNCATR